jgi:hypothetical protein
VADNRKPQVPTRTTHKPLRGPCRYGIALTKCGKYL